MDISESHDSYWSTAQPRCSCVKQGRPYTTPGPRNIKPRISGHHTALIGARCEPGSDHKRPQRSLTPDSKQGAATSRPGFGRMGGIVCAQNKNGWTPLYTRHHSVQRRSASTHLRCIWPHRRREKLEPTQPLLTRYRCHQPPWTIERQGVSHTGMREGGTSHPRFLQHFRVAWGGARQLMIHDLLQIPALGVPMAIKLVSLEIGMNRFLRPYAGSECALWEDTVILYSNECAQ